MTTIEFLDLQNKRLSELEKENEELKEQIVREHIEYDDKLHYMYSREEELLEEIEELKAKIEALQNGTEVCWQGDMDRTIAQNLELKNQIKGMQNNLDGQKARKNHYMKENDRLKRENKLLLDTSKLMCESCEKCSKELKAQIELMKCCENCENEVYQRIVIRGTMPIICDICKDLSKWEFKK